jgi:hypothetical protein
MDDFHQIQIPMQILQKLKGTFAMARRKHRRVRKRFPLPDLCEVYEVSYEHTPGADTEVCVVSEYEQKCTGIYTTRTFIGETRTSIPLGGYTDVSLTEDEQLDLMMTSSRLDAVSIVGKRLTVLTNDDAGGVWLDLGCGRHRYSIPDDVSVEEVDALDVLRSLDRTEQVLSNGGSASGVMRGISLGFAVEKLRIRPCESAVRHSRKARTSLPAARKARSAKSEVRKQWAWDNYPRHLASGNNNPKTALRTMEAEFSKVFTNETVTRRTICEWVAAQPLSQTKKTASVQSRAASVQSRL